MKVEFESQTREAVEELLKEMQLQNNWHFRGKFFKILEAAYTDGYLSGLRVGRLKESQEYEERLAYERDWEHTTKGYNQERDEGTNW